MATLERAFGVRTIVDAVEQHPDATIREDLPTVKLFKMGKRGRVAGNLAYFDRRQKRRRLAPIGGRNDAPHEVTPPDETEVSVGVFSTVETHPFFPNEIFVDKRGFGQQVLDNAPERCMEAVENLMSNARRTQELICSQYLQSAGAAVTINSSLIPNTKLTQSIQNTDIQTQAMGAKWTTATTKILSSSTGQLKSAKKLLKDVGYRAGMLIHTDAAAAGLYGNNEIKDWAGRAGGLDLGYLREHLPGFDQAASRRGDDPFMGGPLNKVGGIEKWLEWDHGYDLEVGGGSPDTFTKFYNDTKAILLPDAVDIPNVLGWAEAPALVPTGPNIIGGGDAAGMITKKDGIAVYAYMELDYPHRIVIVCQAHWVCYIRDGKGIVTLTSIT